MTEHVLAGTRGAITAHEWPNPTARYLALVVHGYGEHAGRYEELAGVLTAHGAAVFAPDHMGHGRSDGERVRIEDFEDVVSDVRAVAELARAAHPEPPLVVIGHSMGGLIAARYTQRYGDGLRACVISPGGCWRTRRSPTSPSAPPRSPVTRRSGRRTRRTPWSGTGR
ncbi:alpha/beta fold hydrolase [Streptomyces sp. T028]|uniref:alpha/beta fold hydrolase n=1 Tax=Streptomyces sp. T028 TaxID=3394379 RepID=UPI003A8C098A